MQKCPIYWFTYLLRDESPRGTAGHGGKGVAVAGAVANDAISYSVDESFKKFRGPNSDADGFQNLMASSLSKNTSLVKFSFLEYLVFFT